MNKLPGEPGTRSIAVMSAVVTGAAGAALGPAAAVVSAGIFGVWNEAILHKCARYVGDRMAEVAKTFDPHDPQAYAIFNKLTFAALQTSRHDKWALLVDALGNSGRSSPDPDYVQELFADYVMRYTPHNMQQLPH